MTTRLGEKIRELRKAKNLTLETLATSAGISKSYLWELENREAQSPSYEKLVGIADQLGVTINYLIEDDQRTPEEQDRDAVFYRGYQGLKPDAKEQLRKILDTFKDQ